ncbi:transposase [Colletotrichum incanum]|nr:transposase [Colletotrichum incanum]
MDETGIPEGKGSNGLVLGRAETKSVRKKQPGSRAWVSIIECISAEGIPLHPLVIYKGKTVQQQWFPLDLSPYDGWEFTATENGWTTDETAVTWLKRVFLTPGRPRSDVSLRTLEVAGGCRNFLAQLSGLGDPCSQGARKASESYYPLSRLRLTFQLRTVLLY